MVPERSFRLRSLIKRSVGDYGIEGTSPAFTEPYNVVKLAYCASDAGIVPVSWFESSMLHQYVMGYEQRLRQISATEKPAPQFAYMAVKEPEFPNHCGIVPVNELWLRVLF